MKKGLLILLGAFILLFGGMTASAQDAIIKINGEILETEYAPVNIDGRILIPLRDVGEALQCEVLWNNEQKGISMSDGNDIYLLWIERDTLFKITDVGISDTYISDVTPKLIEEKTMIPIRCIAELMGAKVDWIDDEKTVTVDFIPNPTEAAYDIAAIGNEIINVLAQDGYAIYSDYVNKKHIVKAEIELENGGIIKLDLFPDIAPITVSNFITLASEGVFDNTIFHRVIKDFMIQGGGFDVELQYNDKLTPIIGEFIANGWFNFLSHKRGAISMARTNDPNSATNQFFIVHQDSTFLNTQYAAFGEVTDGMEYVDAIAETETDVSDMPLETQLIKTIRIIND